MRQRAESERRLSIMREMEADALEQNKKYEELQKKL